MGKHQRVSENSLSAKTVIGGALVSGALLIGAPAGMAMAKPVTTTNTDHNRLAGPAVSRPQGPTQSQRLAFVTKVSSTKVGQAAFGVLAKDPKALAAVSGLIGKFVAAGPVG